MMLRWFKDFALEKRISHIVSCTEKNQWPVGKNYSAYTGCQGVDLDIPLNETVTHINLVDRRSETPDVITITTDQGVPKHLQAQLQNTPTSSSGGNSSLSVSAAAAAAVAAAMNNSISLSPVVNSSNVGGNLNTIAINMGMGNNTSSGKKRKRHIAIDVETDRAKLHALLNSSQVTSKLQFS